MISSNERIERNFQSILDGRGHPVRATYLGSRKLGIVGLVADVDACRDEVGLIFDVVTEMELDDGRKICTFYAPAEKEAAARASAALLNLSLHKRSR